MTVNTDSGLQISSAFQPEVFVRRPFDVAAIQVTADNMEEVSDWCSGEMRKTAENVPFIKVPVRRPLNTRQTRAFVGDWVLYGGREFKVYTTQAFNNAFVKKESV